MLVLSAAVFVIVIDARDVGRWVWRAVGISRRRGGTEVLLASGDYEIDEVARMGIGGGSEVGRFVGSHEPDRLRRARNVLGSRRQSKTATTSTVSAETN